MKLAPPDDRDGLTPPRVLVALCLCAVLPLLAYAAVPAWWSGRGVTIAGATPDDYAPVNQGQLKNIAVTAIAELDAKLPGGAGDALHALANNWATLNPQANDYTAVNLGQLKNIAKPFYDRLMSASLADRYPWADASPPRDDFAIANIGQVKNLFSFALPDVVGVDGPILDRLAAGSVGSLALETDGRVWIWGDAIAGGNGARVAWPRRINGLSGVRSVAAGQGHVAVLRSGGTVWTWGDNAAGQLGDGTNPSRATPAAVPNVANALAVKAGDSHTLVLQDDGTVVAWGGNYYGQLGIGLTEASATPVMVTGLTDVRKIAAGHSRSVALKNDGTVWTWGYERYAWQTGDDVFSATPVMVTGLNDAIDIAAGYEHVVAVRADGTVWAWGSNYSNQVANGYGWWQYQDSPFQVPNLPPIVAVASRHDHTLAIAQDGTVWAWGNNGSGQLGDGTSAQRRTPVRVSGLTDAVAVATDYSYSLAMRADGSVWAWGYGAQGTAPGADLYVPQPVILGLADANGNGMDDRWEMQYFWNLEAAAGSDEDGDGLTNLQEFQQGTDPRDYFNGTTPTIEILSGNSQMSDPETFAPDGLTVRVLTAAGVPLVNAPVTFTVTQGWGNLALTPGGDLEWGSVTVRTDTEGNAAAFYRLPPYADNVSLVTASAGPSAAPAAVTFTATTTNPPPPEAASQVNATRNEDGTVTITWTDNSTNEEAFIVEMQAPDGSWQAIAWLDPNTTTYTTNAAGGGNYRVRAPRYGASAPAEETNAPKTSYAIIDLGEKHTPMRVTNSGYVLLQAYYPTPPKRWYQGNVETLTGGDDNALVGAMDINEAGTVVGSVLLYRPGSAPEYGTASWLDSEWSWYRRTDYGVRLASRWDAGKTAAAPLTAKSFSFSIYDGREGQPWVGSAASASAITIDDNGHIYGWSIADYGEFTPYYPPPDDFYDRTRWGAAYSGYDFTANKVLGDQKVVYHPEPLYSDAEKRYTDRFVTEGDPYYIVKARGGSTIGGYNSYGGGWTINGKEEDFRGINLNSHGRVLIAVEESPSSHYVYDPSNGSRTSLGMTPPRWFGSAGQPQALNHRTIAATDATGQQTTKVSPQVVGYFGSNWGSSGAALWEEDPKSGQYWMRYLNGLLPENSGWKLEYAYDINDNGVIACVGSFQPRDDEGNPVGQPQKRGCLLMPMELMVDGNRDGEMSFSAERRSADRTSAERPYRFWVNDDDDGAAATEGDQVPASTPDYADGVMRSPRDLEDFTRLHVNVSGLEHALESGGIKAAFEWRETSGTAGSAGPRVKLYRATSGGTDYLTNESAANSATLAPFRDTLGEVVPGAPLFMPEGFWLTQSPYANVPKTLPTAWFWFEGSGEGKGRLILSFWKGNERIGEAQGVWLDLTNIKTMYQRGKAQPEDIAAPNGSSSAPFTGASWYVDDAINAQFRFVADPDEEKKAVIFVHGWSVDYNDYTNVAETMFKRLWHQGFKGRFCSLRWDPLVVAEIWNIISVSAGQYNRSEHRAWLYGESLKQFTMAINAEGFSVSLIGHSMGNIICGSSLQKGLAVDNYLLMQAAVPAGAYDSRGGDGIGGVNGYPRFWRAEVNQPTPDFHQSPNGELTKGYRGFLEGVGENVAGEIVNFHNSDDYALATGHKAFDAIETNWEANQENYKPDGSSVGRWRYRYNPLESNLDQRGVQEFTDAEHRVVNSRFVTDSYEMKSFVARPRSKAAGAVEGSGDNPVARGTIDSNINMRRDYGFTPNAEDHSGQFTRPIQQVHRLYQRIFEIVR